jgi:flagellin
VGSGNEANDRINISIGNARASALGVGGGSGWAVQSIGASVNTAALTSGGLTINGFNIGASTNDGVSYSNVTGSGIAKAAAINAVSGQTGVTATVGKTESTGVVSTSQANGTLATDLKINGVAIDAISVTSGTGAAIVRGSQTAAAINSKSTLTGVTAVSDNTGKVTMTAMDGRNILVEATARGVAETGLGNISGTTLGNKNVVTFSDMQLGESVTVAGVIYTAAADVTASTVATAFASYTASGGVFSGTATAGWAFSAGPSAGTVTVTNATTTSATAAVTTGSAVKTSPTVATATTPANGGAGNEPSVVSFASLSKGESLTVNGVSYTAASSMTGAQVATAFAGYTGAGSAGFTGSPTVSTWTMTGRSVTNTSDISYAQATGTNLAAAITVSQTNLAPIVPSVNTYEQNEITFTNPLKAGESVTLAGLTFTSAGDTAVADLATVFSNIAAGATTSAGLGTFGKFSGAMTGFSSGAVSAGKITLTSTTANTDVSPLVATSYASKITLNSSTSQGITLGGTEGVAAIGQVAGYSQANATDSAGVSSINLATASGSQAALNILDKAINTITDSRASMGAYQNRLTASISNLEVSSMNLQASRSRILDTDYAKETTNLAKSQIIQQAATAMLAQANQSAQSVLSLLK